MIQFKNRHYERDIHRSIGILTSGSVDKKTITRSSVKLSWVIHPILPWKRPRCCLLWELRIWFSSALQDPRRSRSANPSSRRWGTRPSWQCTKKSWSKWRTTTYPPLSALTRPWETRIQPVQSEISFGDVGQSETRFSDMNLKQPCICSKIESRSLQTWFQVSLLKGSIVKLEIHISRVCSFRNKRVTVILFYSIFISSR